MLDGHLFSLFGLYDYIRAVPPETEPAGHELAQSLFSEGIQGLIKQLPRYDMGYWLRFNRCDLPGYPQNDPCTIGYLRLVRQQLIILYRITGEEQLQYYADLCRKYDRLPNILKMYREKFRVLKSLNRL